MDAKTLIAHVRAAQAGTWQNSDLWQQSEDMLVAIVDHLEQCPACREAFDAQGYRAATLIEFEAEHLGNTTIDDWTCEVPTIDLSALDYDDPLALLEEDYSGEGARQALLVLEWERGRITAETRNVQIDGTPAIRWHGRESAYLLPSLVDATRLREWAVAELLPHARPLFAAYERQGDGDNWVGAFPGHEHEKQEFDGWMAYEAEPPLLPGEDAGIWPIEEWLVDAPEDLTPETTDAELRALAADLIAEARREQIVLAGNVAQYLEEMREEMRETAAPSPDLYQIAGYEVIEAKARPFGSSSAHVPLPGRYQGKRLKIVLIEPLDEEWRP